MSQAEEKLAKVFETTAAVSVGVTDDLIIITQEDFNGEEAERIVFPRPLLKDVLSTIFAVLDPWELEPIAEIAESFSRPESARE